MHFYVFQQENCRYASNLVDEKKVSAIITIASKEYDINCPTIIGRAPTDYNVNNTNEYENMKICKYLQINMHCCSLFPAVPILFHQILLAKILPKREWIRIQLENAESLAGSRYTLAPIGRIDAAESRDKVRIFLRALMAEWAVKKGPKCESQEDIEIYLTVIRLMIAFKCSQ